MSNGGNCYKRNIAGHENENAKGRVMEDFFVGEIQAEEDRKGRGVELDRVEGRYCKKQKEQ